MNHAFLKEIPLFAELQESALRAIASCGVVRHFPKNAVLLIEGDHTDSLHVILAGKVKVYCGDADGREVVLNILGPSDYFGELAVIDGEPRSASVMTLEPTQVFVIFRDDFLQHLSQEPEIAINLLTTLVRKVRRETECLKGLALMDVYGRVAKLLLELATEREGKLVVERLTYREIATRIGASREMVGRIFKDLRSGGYITVEADRIVINEDLPQKW
jgi:CRP/FNR family cyclic AMP-dependent transcriptional regulator